jgi:hypothetical protein
MDLDNEACNAPKILLKYGALAADLSTQAATEKARAEIKYSEISQNIREKHAGERITEGTIKGMILTDVEYQQCLARQLQAEGYHKKVENMYKTLLKRVDLIISLTYKQRTEIAKNAF